MTVAAAFGTTPEAPAAYCPQGEVHVWRVALDSAVTHDRILSQQERERAARLASLAGRRRWVAARTALRIVLGRTVRVPPEEIVFETEPGGKPQLAGNNGTVNFSVSHSGGLALIAVSGERGLGIDAENVRPMPHYRDMARRFFAPAEFDEIEALPAEQRIGAFFACWTRKEAVVKALGVGLAADFGAFVTTVRPDVPPRLVSIGIGNEAAERWQLAELSEPGFAAALAVRQPGAVVRRFAFPPPPRE